MGAIRTGPFSGLKLHGYSVLYPDPPWEFRTYNRVKVTGRGKVKHYSTMPTEDIAALPVGDLAADDCAMFLWVHNAMFEAAFEVLKAWDFRFKSVAFVWTKITKAGKPHMGGGYGTRSCTEQCWLATRGRPKRLNADVRQAILEPRREAHRKPDRVRGDIERLFAGDELVPDPQVARDRQALACASIAFRAMKEGFPIHSAAVGMNQIAPRRDVKRLRVNSTK